MPEIILSADNGVDIAKNVLWKMPCKWGECEFVLNSWRMVKEVWLHPSIKFTLELEQNVLLPCWLHQVKWTQIPHFMSPNYENCCFQSLI
jgi:hypothetical protein